MRHRLVVTAASGTALESAAPAAATAPMAFVLLASVHLQKHQNIKKKMKMPVVNYKNIKN